MRLLVDLHSHVSSLPSPQIIQVQKVPQHGAEGREIVNGKYVLPVPLGVDFPIEPSDYILNGAGEIDGGDVSSRGFAHLLASYPQYDHIYFNPLLTSAHVGELVEVGSLAAGEHITDRTLNPEAVFYPRFQTGRSGAVDGGQMPTHTALLPANTGVTPSRPGLILTKAIDIGPYTLDCDANEVGADEFVLYWKLFKFSVTHDISAASGAHAGTNTPALRYIEETDDEPSGFSAYISTDGGATWCDANLLAPVSYCDRSKSVRVAFRNDSAEKLYLACFALLF